MKIGIDIDDTITDTWEYIIPIYSKIFNKSIDEIKKGEPYFYSIEDTGISLASYFKMLNPYFEKIIPNVPLKKDAKEVINKLHSEGHQIIFITARGKMYHDEYKISADYLKKHNIYYDKLITNSQAKDKTCQEEQIDLFIDDNIKHCQSVSNIGKEVLMFENYYNKDYSNVKHVKTWKEIYEYIQSRWYCGRK